MKGRKMLENIFRKGINAVAPDAALLAHIKVENNAIKAGDKNFEIPEGGIYVVGAGKGAAPMAQALEKLLGDHIKDGFIVVKYGHSLPLKRIVVEEAAHPVPDEASLKAVRRIRETASMAKSDGLLICLFTGGASSLLGEPLDPITLEEWAETTKILLACGADIKEINTIRRHLMQLGGGKLALEAYGSPILSLLVSDVPGDDPLDIASAPTINDFTPYLESLEIMKKYDLEKKLPARIVKSLADLAEYGTILFQYPAMNNDELFLYDDDFGDDPFDNEDEDLDEEDDDKDVVPGLPEEAFELVTNVIIASNGQALQGAAQQARLEGYRTFIDEEPLTGEAREAARRLIKKARLIQEDITDQPVCLLTGGETTVTLRGNGKGGRNQEMALAAAIELEGSSGICALFAGTDGTDGPTDAAGGFAFANTVEKMGGIKKAKAALANNDSYYALEKSGDLFVTGPTLTNVMDMVIILIHPVVKKPDALV